MNSVDLSIVVPGYNEGEIIIENLRAIHDAACETGVSFEIIFVNDGSTDDTSTKVAALAQELSELSLISYNPNAGRGYALRQGFAQAKGRYILTVESDLNYGREIIKGLYNAIKASAFDIIVASPYMKGGKALNVPAKRIFLSKWGNKLLSASIGNVVHTVSGMTRIYASECIKSLPLISNDKEIHLEIISKALSLGFRISEIPATLNWPDRKARKTTKRKSSFASRKFILTHLTFTFLERPLMLFGALGIASFIGGALLGGYVVYLRYFGRLNPNRPLITLVVLMVLGGTLLISMGLLGMQINALRNEVYRIQKDLKNRPVM